MILAEDSSFEKDAKFKRDGNSTEDDPRLISFKNLNYK